MPLPVVISFAVVGGIASLSAMVLIAGVLFAKPKVSAETIRDRAFLASILLAIGLPCLGLSAYNSEPWRVWMGLGLALLMGASLIVGNPYLRDDGEDS